MNAVVKIFGEIDEKNTLNIVDQLISALGNDKIDQIVLLIRSGGGKVRAIDTIWELIKLSDKKVVSVGIGYVASTASALFMMGERRILFPKTEFLLHKSSSRFQGDYTSDHLESRIKNEKEATDILWEPVIKNSQMTHQLMSRKTKNKDWFLNEEEIAKYEIITEPYNPEEVKKLII